MIKEFLRTLVIRLLTLEARAVLKKYKPNVMVVTGSVGKTSTKDAVYAALKGHTFVRKSEKSYNSDVGVPLTVLGVPNGWSDLVQWSKNLLDGFLLLLITTPYPRWLVLEVGADRPGDISKSLSWLTPCVVVATRFPDLPVHVEFYDSPEAVFREEVFPLSMLSTGGVAVLNADEPRLESVEVPKGVSIIRYGFGKNAEVRATKYRVTKKAGLPSGISFEVTHQGETAEVALPKVIGKTHVYALLAGIAGALAAGDSFSHAVHVGEHYEAPVGRLRLIEGLSGSVIIDDTYNASPVAVVEALSALQNTTHTGRRIAVLGDMLELGSHSVAEHHKVGEHTVSQTDIIVTVGVRARGIAEAALEKGMPVSMVHMFERGSDAAGFLVSALQKGDVVLVKGSQSMRMERISKALMFHPEDASQELPRQDAEWLAR